MILKTSIKIHSVLAPSDTMNIFGKFDEEGNCDFGRENNLLIVLDILVSRTQVIFLYLSKFNVNLWKHVLHLVHGLNPCL